MTIKIVRQSSKSLRDARQVVVRGVFPKIADKVRETATDTPLNEGVSDLVETESAAKLACFLRETAKRTNGNVEAIAKELFTPQEREDLQTIESELWNRGEKKTPPKVGSHVAVKLLLRFAETNLMRSCVKGDDSPFKGEDGEACFRESLWSNVPKIRTPKAGGISTESQDDIIAKLLGWA